MLKLKVVQGILHDDVSKDMLSLCFNFCMSFVDWFIASFLYCFPYSYHSFTLLKALAKSNSNLIAIAFKSKKEQQLSQLDNFRKEAIKKEAKN